MSNCFLSYCIVEEFKSWAIDVEYERVRRVLGDIFAWQFCASICTAHQLGYVDGRIVTLTSMEIRDHLEALYTAHVVTDSPTSPCSNRCCLKFVASISCRCNSSHRLDKDDDDNGHLRWCGNRTRHGHLGRLAEFRLSLPGANSEWINAGTQTEPLDFRNAPSIVYHAGTQTTAPQTISVTVMVNSDKWRWSRDHRERTVTLSEFSDFALVNIMYILLYKLCYLCYVIMLLWY